MSQSDIMLIVCIGAIALLCKLFDFVVARYSTDTPRDGFKFCLRQKVFVHWHSQTYLEGRIVGLFVKDDGTRQYLIQYPKNRRGPPQPAEYVAAVENDIVAKA